MTGLSRTSTFRTRCSTLDITINFSFMFQPDFSPKFSKIQVSIYPSNSENQPEFPDRPDHKPYSIPSELADSLNLINRPNQENVSIRGSCSGSKGTENAIGMLQTRWPQWSSVPALQVHPSRQLCMHGMQEPTGQQPDLQPGAGISEKTSPKRAGSSRQFCMPFLSLPTVSAELEG